MYALEDQERYEVLRGIDGYIFDKDGVLTEIRNGRNEMFDGVKEGMQYLHDNGIEFVLATNNTSKPASAYAQDFAIPEERVYTGTDATLEYLQREGIKTVHAIYEKDCYVMDQMRQAGIKVLTTEDIHPSNGQRANYGKIDAVLTGYKREFSSRDIEAGANVVMDHGARLLVCGDDLVERFDDSYHANSGIIANGIRDMLKATHTPYREEQILKPGQYFYENASLRLGDRARSVAVIGDTPSTDMAQGDKDTKRIFVLTNFPQYKGRHGDFYKEVVSQWDPAWRPDLVYDEVGDLFKDIEKANEP